MDVLVRGASEPATSCRTSPSRRRDEHRVRSLACGIENSVSVVASDYPPRSAGVEPAEPRLKKALTPPAGTGWGGHVGDRHGG
jgi:hypothetical protein